MQTEYLVWISLALTVAVLVFTVWRTKPQTVASMADAVSDAAYTARTLVEAAEQLGKTGKLPTNDAKFNYVLAELQRMYPALDTEQLRIAIEAAVFWLRRLPVKSNAD